MDDKRKIEEAKKAIDAIYEKMLVTLAEMEKIRTEMNKKQE